MAAKIFIGSLSYSTTEETLRELFSQYGEVEKVAVIMDRETNRPRGIAFVEMTDEDAAQKAIKELNETELDGRKIIVNTARERDDRPRQPRQGGGNGGNSFRRSW